MRKISKYINGALALAMSLALTPVYRADALIYDQSKHKDFNDNFYAGKYNHKDFMLATSLDKDNKPIYRGDAEFNYGYIQDSFNGKIFPEDCHALFKRETSSDGKIKFFGEELTLIIAYKKATGKDVFKKDDYIFKNVKYKNEAEYTSYFKNHRCEHLVLTITNDNINAKSVVMKQKKGSRVVRLGDLLSACFRTTFPVGTKIELHTSENKTVDLKDGYIIKGAGNVFSNQKDHLPILQFKDYKPSLTETCKELEVVLGNNKAVTVDPNTFTADLRGQNLTEHNTFRLRWKNNVDDTILSKQTYNFIYDTKSPEVEITDNGFTTNPYSPDEVYTSTNPEIKINIKDLTKDQARVEVRDYRGHEIAGYDSKTKTIKPSITNDEVHIPQARIFVTDAGGNQTIKDLYSVNQGIYKRKGFVDHYDMDMDVYVDGNTNTPNTFAHKDSTITIVFSGKKEQSIKDMQLNIGNNLRLDQYDQLNELPAWINSGKYKDQYVEVYQVKASQIFNNETRVVEINAEALIQKDKGKTPVTATEKIKFDYENPKVSTTLVPDEKLFTMGSDRVYVKDEITIPIIADDGKGSGIANILISNEQVKDQRKKAMTGADGSTATTKLIKVDASNKIIQPVIQVMDNCKNITKTTLGELLGDPRFDIIVFDQAGPQINVNVSGTTALQNIDGKTFISENGELNIQAMDEDSQVASLSVKVNGENIDKLLVGGVEQSTNEVSAGTIKLTKEGKNTVVVESEDLLGNKSKHESVYYIDTTPPKAPEGIFENLDPALVYNKEYIFQDKIEFSLKQKPVEEWESGIASFTLKTDQGVLDTDNRGIYTFNSVPKDFNMAMRDKYGNAITYKFHQLENMPELKNLHIDKQAPVITIDQPIGRYPGNWYDSDKICSIHAKDDVTLKSVVVKINGKEYKRIEPAKDGLTPNIDITFDTRDREYEGKDGYYIEVFTEDAVGRKDKKDIQLRIDRDAPVIDQFVFEGKGTQEGAEINGTNRYGFFFTGKSRVTIYAHDPNMSSGLNRVYYTLYDQNGKIFDDQKGVVEFKNDMAVVDLPEDFKGFIEAFAEDNVQHQGATEKPDGFVNSNMVLNANIIDIELPETEYKDINGLSLYPADVTGNIVIYPNDSGWKSVRWGTMINKQEKEYGNVNIDKDGKLSGADATVSWRDKNLVLDLKSMMTVADNTNDITIWVRVLDRRGQESYKQVRFSIDKDKPVIDVKFDNNNIKNIYAQKRTATLTVTERNFKSDDVKISGNNTGISEWIDSGDNKHQCKIEFGENDDYQLIVDYKDMAGNVADSFVSEKFTIDTIIPVMTIKYSRTDAKNGMYYDGGRTATLTLTEHNFDPSLITIDGKGIQGDWHSEGDVHTNTILFNADDEYVFTVSGTDRAGNKLETYTSDLFVVDTQEPVIAVSGVEAGKSHQGDININVTLSDSYIDPEKISVNLESLKHGNIPLESSINANTATFVLSNLPKELEWDDGYLLSISVYDKAGNTNAREVSFTVNRFGSQYQVQQSDVMGQITAQLPPEFVFKESSPDPIDMEKTTIELTKNGETYTYDSSYLTKKEKKTADGYDYTYTLKTNAFVEDGKYTVAVVSQAKDGTINASSKNNFVFVYDTSAPEISITGIQSNASCQVDEQTVTVDFDDLSGVVESSIKVNGEEIDPEATDLYQKFMLAKSDERYTVEVRARDQAGNEQVRTVENVRVTRDMFTILKDHLNAQAAVTVIGGCLVIFMMLFIWGGLRIRKADKEIVEENEE